MDTKQIHWNEVAELFRLLAVIFRDEGRTEMPAYDSVPSQVIDEECDAFCRMLAEDLDDPPLPPPSIRSWMMARSISASSLATQLAKQKEDSPGLLSRQLVEQLLIHEWHGAFRDQWRSLADGSQFFSC